MKMQCTVCGVTTAVRNDDYAIFDCFYGVEKNETEFIGIIRKHVCNQCIEDKYRKDNPDKPSSISWIGIIIFAILTPFVTIIASSFGHWVITWFVLIGFGGGTLYSINENLNTIAEIKERKKKLTDAKNNNFQNLSDDFFGLFCCEDKNQKLLVNVFDVLPLIKENDTLDDILQRKELSAQIPEKKELERYYRDYVPMKECAEQYTKYFATPMPEWITVAYQRKCAGTHEWINNS